MLEKQNLNINFADGLDTKTDPWQVAPNNFLVLKNQVFTKGKRLTKRNGYGRLTALPNSSAAYLTTLNDNLTAIGNSIYAYNQDSQRWVTKGTIQPMQVNTLSLIKNNINQTQCDAAVASNGLVCTVYSESNNGVSDYRYAIADSVTGQNIIAPSAIPVASGTVTGSPRVFVLGNFFIIVFTNVISATSHLQYVAISQTNPSTVTTNADIASAYISATTVNWDGVVANGVLYIGYNTTSGGQAIKVTSLTAPVAAAGGAPATAVTFLGYAATIMSLCADTTATTPTIYVNFYTASVGYSLAVNNNLSTVMLPVQIIPSGTILNLASAAQNGTCTIFYEVSNAYSYDGAIATNLIKSISVTPTGVPVSFHSVFSTAAGTITASSASGLSNGMYLVDVTTKANITANTTFTISSTTLTLSANTAGNSASSPGDLMNAQAVTLSSAITVIRSVGLASKAFIVDGVIYFLSTFSSPYQPTYFLMNGSTSTAAAPVISGKLAYQNGGGYLTLGLPSVTVQDDNVCFVAYLFKDLIAAVNKGTNLASGTQTAGIYSQTGINLGTFTIGTDKIDTAEIGKDLLISGGFLWMYDGYLPVEQNFFLWPDSVEAATQNDPTPTGTVSDSVTPTIITAVSSVAGIVVGMTISGTGIPANTTVLSVGTTTITMSAAATSAHSAETITFTGNQAAQAYFYQAVYEWSDNQGNIYRSAPSIPVTATTSSGHSSVVINVPTLRLTYKTANPVKIVLYRWSTAQQVYYQVTSLTAPTLNSTTTDSVSYTDVLSDATILGNNIIYTNGGVLENVNAPASNVMTLFDDREWLLDAEDKNLFWYSKQVIEATPVEMSDALTYYFAPSIGAQGPTGDVGAAAPMDDKLIVWKKQSAIYYINGTGPDNTGANGQYSQPIFITSTLGCDNQQSIVFQPGGLMFQASNGKGIWLLGRDLSTSYIGAPVEDFNSSTVQSAVNIPTANQVRFTLDTGETLVYDYYYEQWSTFVGVPAISSCIYGGLHTFLNSSGAVYQETANAYLDGSNPVLVGLTTAWFNLAGLQGYQRAFFFYLLGKYLTPHKLQLTIAYDYNPSPRQSSIINPTNYSNVLGGPTPNPDDGTDSESPLGQTQYLGGSRDGSVEQWRVFLTKQRCQSFQISIQEVYDPSFGAPAGAGLTLSGINLIYGVKKGFRPMPARLTVGGGTR